MVATTRQCYSLCFESCTVWRHSQETERHLAYRLNWQSYWLAGLASSKTRSSATRAARACAVAALKALDGSDKLSCGGSACLFDGNVRGTWSKQMVFRPCACTHALPYTKIGRSSSCRTDTSIPSTNSASYSDARGKIWSWRLCCSRRCRTQKWQGSLLLTFFDFANFATSTNFVARE